MIHVLWIIPIAFVAFMLGFALSAMFAVASYADDVMDEYPPRASEMHGVE